MTRSHCVLLLLSPRETVHGKIRMMSRMVQKLTMFKQEQLVSCMKSILSDVLHEPHRLYIRADARGEKKFESL